MGGVVDVMVLGNYNMKRSILEKNYYNTTNLRSYNIETFEICCAYSEYSISFIDKVLNKKLFLYLIGIEDVQPFIFAFRQV